MDHLRIFHDVARALTSTLAVDEVLQTIMTKMTQFFGPEKWSLLMVDEATNDLYYAVAIGENPQSLRGLRIKMGEGIAGWVAETGNPLVVPDVNADAQWAEFAKANSGLNIQSIACLPIRSGDKTLGVIQLLNSKLDLMSEYSISFLRILCDYAAIAIQNARSMTRIQELSITDDCTGLFNARHLYVLLEQEIVNNRERMKRPFSLLFVDLDRFKQVNDTHGHLVGSRLLSDAGNLMKRVIGPSNAAFRYGGDEFVALLPGADLEHAREICDAVLEGAARDEVIHGERAGAEDYGKLWAGDVSGRRRGYPGNHQVSRHNDVPGEGEWTRQGGELPRMEPVTEMPAVRLAAHSFV